MSYRDEFPDFDDELPTLPDFEDISCHNDACPSMFSNPLRLAIYVDYKDPEKREMPAPRYCLYHTDRYGGRLMSGQDHPLDTDDWDEIVAVIDAARTLPENARRLDIHRKATDAGFHWDDLIPGTSQAGPPAWIKAGMGVRSVDGVDAYPTPEQEAAGWRVAPYAEPDTEGSIHATLEEALAAANVILPAAPSTLR